VRRRGEATIIITPLVALRLQLKATCVDFGLDVEMFVKGCTRKAKVIIVVTETEDFCDFIMKLQPNRQRDRVVWDEAHTLVKDPKEYRLTIEGCAALQLHCQLVFITATCPPTLVDEICELMVLPLPHVIRQDYWKPLFRYSVTICQNLDLTAKTTIQTTYYWTLTLLSAGIRTYSKINVCGRAGAKLKRSQTRPYSKTNVESSGGAEQEGRTECA
jgi:superfamily II DNA helicase RecQ